MLTELFPGDWLPVAFAVLMGISILVYVILDGYDLGVGILLNGADAAEKDRMIASIGPFWDANETWLVLAVGLLLVGFPLAHGEILSTLYLPVTLMLIGLILRGVAFDFRAKAHIRQKGLWNAVFFAGSLLAAGTQGIMLGLYIMGFEASLGAAAFAGLVGLCLACAYALLGACWLIVKTEGTLRRKAIGWAQRTLWFAVLGMLAISAATPFLSERVFAKWFSLPEIVLLAPLPLVTAGLFAALWFVLRHMPDNHTRFDRLPFALVTGIVVLGFHGLAYSFFPYVVPEHLTIWQAASARDSLGIIFAGAVVVMPLVIGSTAFVYRVFRGKATDLSYD